MSESLPASRAVAAAVGRTGALAYMAYGYRNLSAVPRDKVTTPFRLLSLFANAYIQWIRQQVGGHWQFLTIQGSIPGSSTCLTLTPAYTLRFRACRCLYHAPFQFTCRSLS